MSTSARFARLVDSAWKNDDLSSAQQAFYEYLDVNCLHPLRQEIFDSHSMTRRVINVPCGKCYHCVHSKINEWCTRMYAHAEDFKHIYFVTLTYRSFYDSDRPVNKLMLNKLSQAVWHRDSKNSTHHVCYSPCLLVKKHYQDFMKRLRKLSGLSDITYVLSGEYGHDYGRPHFHIILFTNGELTAHHVSRAWSVALWRSNSGVWSYKTSQKNAGVAYYFPIGRVDFNDLVSNGTFNTTAKIKVDNTFMNAANCFSYVCKYVCKRDDANLSRVRLAYDSLYHKQKFYQLFDNQISCNKAYDYLKKVGYNDLQIKPVLNNKNLVSYEKYVYEPSESIYSENLSNTKVLSLYGKQCSLPFFDEIYYDFSHTFRPFCEFSRGTPIGSVYATRHISEFTEGIFNKPLLQLSSFVVPDYFRRKASEHLYGLRVCRPSRSGLSFVLSELPNLLGRFENASENPLSLREHFNCAKSHVSIAQALHHPNYVFADKSSGEKVILNDGYARHYTYNRHLRHYVNTRNVPVADWIRFWCSSIRDEISRGLLSTQASKESLRLSDAAQCMLTDLGANIDSLKSSYIEYRKSLIKDSDNIYHSLHSSAE